VYKRRKLIVMIDRLRKVMWHTKHDHVIGHCTSCPVSLGNQLIIF